MESFDSIKKTIDQELNHRLKLTIIHHNLKYEINNLEHITQEYTLLVKDQRQKLINYERLHDQWIIKINSNRNHLLKLFNRIHTLEQYLINTNQFLDQFDQMKLSVRPTVLIIYNQMNSFLKQRLSIEYSKRTNSFYIFRREKADIESKSSLNLKLSQMKKFLQSNQITFDQIKQNISLMNRNHSILINQISTINKQRFHLIKYLNFLENKSLIKQQQIFNIENKFNQIKHSIDLNNQKFRQLTFEKQNIGSCLLNKQHGIVLISKHIELNKKNLIQYRLNFNQLMKKIPSIRNQVLDEIQSNKLLKRQNRFDLKQSILSLRKELFEYKKKNNRFQHRQIFNDKSIAKGINKSFLQLTYYSLEKEKKSPKITFDNA